MNDHRPAGMAGLPVVVALGALGLAGLADAAVIIGLATFHAGATGGVPAILLASFALPLAWRSLVPRVVARLEPIALDRARRRREPAPVVLVRRRR